ncbi:MAG: tryptophan synthase subunit alpha [Sandarakinorhabdus sp.]|nr:tryptophan synthase subunit alpha [Sandarakinorhabdus sp.]
MDRLATRFAACSGRAALVTFVCGGDPSPELTAPILEGLVRGGADIIEIGMPFTDPMADGPAIQAGNIRALGAGITLRRLLKIVSDFRSRDADTPLILMGYVNPILAYGVAAFAYDAMAAGLDGVILVDLSPEEADGFLPELAGAGLHLVRLATPTTDAARLPAVLDGASGFLYYVAVAGITGQHSAEEADVAAAVARIKASTSLPVAVGFGVKTPAQARAIARHADAVVVGSAIVDLIGAAHQRQSNDIPGEVEAFVSGLAHAVRAARLENAA